MIQVTCEQCQTAYKVEEQLLGTAGRMVRCMDCRHTWLQEAPPPPPEETPAEEILAAEPMPEITPDWLVEEEKKEGELELVTKEKGKYFHEFEMDIPDAVKPAQVKPPDTAPQPFQIPVMDYRPLGMAAGQFGVCVFLLLSFLTLSGLFIAKRPIVNHMPAMAHFYKSIGFDLKAPGEGLTLAEVTAENRLNGRNRILAVAAKLANISGTPIAPPAVRVQLKGAYGAVLKKWEFSPADKAPLAPGASLPLDIIFNDPPEDGKTVELKIIDK